MQNDVSEIEAIEDEVNNDEDTTIAPLAAGPTKPQPPLATANNAVRLKISSGE